MRQLSILEKMEYQLHKYGNVLFCCQIIFLCLLFSFKQIQTKAHFVGKVVAEFLDDGRTMRLQKEFAYVDSKNKKWHVPPGTIVDGASIPQAFWPLIGGPFEGKYRNASVVHDFYCDAKIIDWQEVHKMFYEACLTGGVENKKAKIMYAAVYAFGPSWENAFVANLKHPGGTALETISSETERIGVYPDSLINSDFKWIEETNPSLDEIVKRMDPLINRQEVNKVIKSNFSYRKSYYKPFNNESIQYADTLIKKIR